ncbi:MAG TPA: hypothetical protein VFL80_01420 [Thermoanaerobaculia bacterium]|nr:hypothetical protein [Thermoanaerobaculia bacterium]
MTALLRSTAALFLLFACSSAWAQTDLTGTWTGIATVQDDCNEQPRTWNSPVSLRLTPSRSGFTGSLLFQEAQLGCVSRKSAQGFFVSGTVSGNTFTLSSPPAGEWNVGLGSGSVTGNSMTITIPGLEQGGLQATLTRTGSSSPVSNLSGLYLGGVTTRETCPTGTFVTFASLSGTVLHSGDLLVGNLRFLQPEHVDRQQSGNCFLHKCLITGTALLTAQITGNSVAGTILAAEEERCDPEGGGEESSDTFEFTGTISGNTITGTAGGGALEFSLVRTSASRRRPV